MTDREIFDCTKSGRGKRIVQLLLPPILLFHFSCSSNLPEKSPANSIIDNKIRLSEAQIAMGNISVAEISEKSIGRNLMLTGILKVNEQSAVTISARVPGRIEKLFIKNAGETVRKGDKLYEYFSEDLANIQREYFNLQSSNWNFTGRYEPSLALENTLLLMGMLPDQIKQLGKDGKIHFSATIYSPASGKIRSINVSEGQYLEEGEPMFELADDADLWVEAQVYPDEIQFLKAGMAATVVIPSAGELEIKSRISFINPSLEKGKNVTLVRAVINNPDGRLHPGMFAMLNVKARVSHGMVIPSSSVISGKETDRVWVREENGDFSVREIITGLQAGDSILVLSGLDPSERIVVSGAYLLNSEFILKQGPVDESGSELPSGNMIMTAK
jgi:Cu(I)/Ag(I) efflux system membrane fusion protein